MIYRFEHFELDPGRFELRADGQPQAVEPQVLSLLILLAGNSERLVTRDEIIERIWHGRIVSEAAISSRIKSARKAIGDDGDRQRLIRTVHGRGLRFVGKVTYLADSRTVVEASPADVAGAEAVRGRQPAIAVLPFDTSGSGGPLAFVGEALADEVIADLARMRGLLVIARGSSFRFRGREVDCREVGGALAVDYCLTGSVDEQRGRLTIAVELARTSDGALLWMERFSAGSEELAEVPEEIVAAIVANLEQRIAHEEASRARMRPEAALGAWGAYHLGLDHMFRFNRGDNARAAALFERALGLDPNFSRAFGGLSFTRFQDAFLQYSPDPQRSAEQARSLAERALQCDPLDPFAHLNLGRALWLDGALAESVDRLGQSIALSPNYAQAIYSKAWAEMTQCNSDGSDANAAQALRLSPLDPLRYAMLAVRSLNAFLRGDSESAAAWGERAARSPGAHKHISVIAALGAKLAGRHDSAAQWIARARQQDPGLSSAVFLRSFPFAASAERETIEATLRDLRL